MKYGVVIQRSTVCPAAQFQIIILQFHIRLFVCFPHLKRINLLHVSIMRENNNQMIPIQNTSHCCFLRLTSGIILGSDPVANLYPIVALSMTYRLSIGLLPPRSDTGLHRGEGEQVKGAAGMNLYHTYMRHSVLLNYIEYIAFVEHKTWPL